MICKVENHQRKPQGEKQRKPKDKGNKNKGKGVKVNQRKRQERGAEEEGGTKTPEQRQEFIQPKG